MTRGAGLLLGALLLTASPVRATQDAFPAHYDVTGVASNDVLNVRASPSASAPIVGQLAPDRQDVEVLELAPGVNWGRVNTGEGTGWVSLHYMERHPGQFLGAFPEVARCAGTEPFWHLVRDGDGYRFGGVDLPDQRMTVGWTGSSLGRRDRHAMTLRPPGDAGETATAVIAYTACSDGMSDRAYGLTMDLVKTGPQGPVLYSGCCTLQP